MASLAVKIDPAGWLLCPHCGHDHTHVVGAKTDRSGTGGRTNANVAFECENGHLFGLVFHQHKGQTAVRGEYIGEVL